MKLVESITDQNQLDFLPVLIQRLTEKLTGNESVNPYATAILELSQRNELVDNFDFYILPSSIILLAGKGFSNLEQVKDPLTGELVTPLQSILETGKVLSSHLDPPFDTAIFISRHDDHILQQFAHIPRPISSMMGGKGPSMADDAESKILIAYGPNYLQKFGLGGIQEVLAEECLWWHKGKPFSPFKEGVAWGLLGKPSLKFTPYEHHRFQQVIEEAGGVNYFSFKRILIDWNACTQEHAFFAYLSAVAGFLTLAASREELKELNADNYQIYVNSLAKFCLLFEQAKILNSQSDQIEIMLPLLYSWSGISDIDKMCEMVDHKIEHFGSSLLQIT